MCPYLLAAQTDAYPLKSSHFFYKHLFSFDVLNQSTSRKSYIIATLSFISGQETQFLLTFTISKTLTLLLNKWLSKASCPKQLSDSFIVSIKRIKLKITFMIQLLQIFLKLTPNWAWQFLKRLKVIYLFLKKNIFSYFSTW